MLARGQLQNGQGMYMLIHLVSIDIPTQSVHVLSLRTSHRLPLPFQWISSTMLGSDEAPCEQSFVWGAG